MIRLSRTSAQLILYAGVLGLLGIQGCEKYATEPVDTIPSRIILKGVHVEPTTFNLFEIGTDSLQSPDDVIPLECIVTVQYSGVSSFSSLSAYYSVYRNQQSTPLQTGELKNDGVAPDTSAADTVFSARVQFSVERQDAGTYYLEVGGTSDGSGANISHLTTLNLVDKNYAPEIISIDSPDTVTLTPVIQLIPLTARVNDRNGLGDIQKVQFNTFSPSGNPSSGNPFVMTNSGDGNYTLTIQLPPQTPTGTYRFEFQAFDRKGLTSPVFIRPMTVRQ